jgi:hypothetical protein
MVMASIATDIADLKENPVPPPTISAYDTATGLYEPHLLQPANIAVYERAVQKNRKGEVMGTVWDYSSQIRILGYYVQYTLGETLALRYSLMPSEDSNHDNMILSVSENYPRCESPDSPNLEHLVRFMGKFELRNTQEA